MTSKIAEIKTALDDLLIERDILATTLALRSGSSINPSKPQKIRDLQVWTLVQGTTADAFSLFSRFSNFGIDKLYIELGQYEITVFSVDRNSIVLCVTPALANKGLLDVEIENARRAIRTILQKPEN